METRSSFSKRCSGCSVLTTKVPTGCSHNLLKFGTRDAAAVVNMAVTARNSKHGHAPRSLSSSTSENSNM